ENRIGRDTDGAVVLLDALCSRVHAVVEHRGQEWHIRDAASRNGTYVNGQKIDDAVLADGHLLRVGSTEFSFHLSQSAAVGPKPRLMHTTQTVVQQTGTDFRESVLVDSISKIGSQQAQDLLLLYQLSIRLLACAEAQEVLRVSLELLRE